MHAVAGDTGQFAVFGFTGREDFVHLIVTCLAEVLEIPLQGDIQGGMGIVATRTPWQLEMGLAAVAIVT